MTKDEMLEEYSSAVEGALDNLDIEFVTLSAGIHLPSNTVNLVADCACDVNEYAFDVTNDEDRYATIESIKTFLFNKGVVASSVSITLGYDEYFQVKVVVPQTC